MRRRTSAEELDARIKSGDRTFIQWLRSAERRNELNTLTRPTRRFIAAYLRKVLTGVAAPTLVLNIGCGFGGQAATVAKVQSRLVHYVGMDHDPECVRRSRQQYGGLSTIQFQPIDYLVPPKLPRKFDYIIVSDVLASLPGYQQLLSNLWQRCNAALIATFPEPLVLDRGSDSLTLDTQERRLYCQWSADRLMEFAGRIAPCVDSFTVFGDTGEGRDHVVALRQSDKVQPLTGIHRAADPAVTFPFYIQGLQ